MNNNNKSCEKQDTVQWAFQIFISSVKKGKRKTASAGFCNDAARELEATWCYMTLETLWMSIRMYKALF